MNIDYSLPCNPSNYRQGNNGRKFIVIHYTGNDGSTAWQNAHYFHESKVEASAHYFIDNDSIFASVPEDDTAWSVGVKYGDAPYWGICKNNNSINIELCTFGGEIQQPTINQALELTKHLMNKYGIPVDNVIRHFDVCAKDCPLPWIRRGDSLWGLFKWSLCEGNIPEINPNQFDAPEPTLRKGSKGAEVRKWQEFLNRFCGANLTIDGDFGNATDYMTRQFQRFWNLDDDGVYGRKTEEATIFVLWCNGIEAV